MIRKVLAYFRHYGEFFPKDSEFSGKIRNIRKMLSEISEYSGKFGKPFLHFRKIPKMQKRQNTLQ